MINIEQGFSRENDNYFRSKSFYELFTGLSLQQIHIIKNCVAYIEQNPQNTLAELRLLENNLVEEIEDNIDIGDEDGYLSQHVKELSSAIVRFVSLAINHRQMVVALESGKYPDAVNVYKQSIVLCEDSLARQIDLFKTVLESRDRQIIFSSLSLVIEELSQTQEEVGPEGDESENTDQVIDMTYQSGWEDATASLTEKNQKLVDLIYEYINFIFNIRDDSGDAKVEDHVKERLFEVFIDKCTAQADHIDGNIQMEQGKIQHFITLLEAVLNISDQYRKLFPDEHSGPHLATAERAQLLQSELTGMVEKIAETFDEDELVKISVSLEEAFDNTYPVEPATELDVYAGPENIHDVILKYENLVRPIIEKYVADPATRQELNAVELGVALPELTDQEISLAELLLKYAGLKIDIEESMNGLLADPNKFAENIVRYDRKLEETLGRIIGLNIGEDRTLSIVELLIKL